MSLNPRTQKRFDGGDQGRDGGKTAPPNINVTPLIDVLLVLLIIFMVVSPTTPGRFKAQIPAPPDANPLILKNPLTLVVEITEDLSVTLIRGQELVAKGSIDEAAPVVARLSREFAEREANNSWRLGLENNPEIPADRRIEKTVFIKAPRSILYGEVARVIDRVKGAGANPIGLQIDELIE